MTLDPSLEEIRKEILRADKACKSAHLLLHEILLEDALCLAYSAVLHAARAALLADGVNVTSHRTVRHLFGQHLIKPGELPTHLAMILAEEQDDRVLVDYDVLFHPEPERVRKRVADAGEFLAAIKTFLADRNIRP